MDFRLLGPLEVTEHDRSLAVGGVKQRSLLAVLLLHANQVVSADRLIDELWGDAPPPTAAKSVQVYVSRLRKELGDGRLVTRRPGYVLHVEPAELDLARFEQLVAARDYEAALALWRGPALADLAYEPFAHTEIARLEELRLATVEQRIDADLQAGRHSELVGELEGLAAAHPLRERLRGQLMLALYRSGRQAEALDAYRATHKQFSAELGLEPGKELRALEQAILEQDPSLDLEAAGARERAVLVVPHALDRVTSLLRLARPLAASGHELIIAGVVAPVRLGAATKALATPRDKLLSEGLSVRTAAFSSPKPADDLVRLAFQENVDLLLTEIRAAELTGEAGILLERAPCDVAMLVEAGEPPRPGPVLVPFGAGWHDWAALELGAWLARAAGVQLRLIGAASDGRYEDRDASRLLADASLIVQRVARIVAEPLLASPGRKGLRATAEGAGLLVVGLSERWRQEGLGEVRSSLVTSPPAPTVLVRRGSRPGGLAPAEAGTRFGWSLTGTS